MFRLHANTSNQSHHCLVVTQSKCWTWCYIWLLLCHNRLLKLFLCLLKYGLISLLTRVQLAPLTSRNMRKSNRNKASAPGSQHEVLHAAPFSWEWEEQWLCLRKQRGKNWTAFTSTNWVCFMSQTESQQEYICGRKQKQKRIHGPQTYCASPISLVTNNCSQQTVAKRRIYVLTVIRSCNTGLRNKVYILASSWSNTADFLCFAAMVSGCKTKTTEVQVHCG